MITIDITKDYLELFMAKKDIEDTLLETKEIERPFTVHEFMKYINFGTHIYWISSAEIYPFKIISTPKESYLFVVSKENTKNINPLLNALSEIKYNYNNLEKKSAIDISTENIIDKPHFIINNDLYYIKKDL